MNDVTEKLNAVLGTSLDRRLVEGDPLRQLGTHHVTVRLSGDHHPQITVVIQSEEQVLAATAPIPDVEAFPAGIPTE